MVMVVNNRCQNTYLLVRRSHVESGLHGAEVGGGSGVLVGGTDGIWQFG